MAPLRPFAIAALLASGVSCIAGATAAQAQASRPATCQRDLFQNEAGMNRETARLRAVAGASQGEQCRVWRAHVAFLAQARSVFATCLSGPRRENHVAEMDNTLAEYRALIRARCG